MSKSKTSLTATERSALAIAAEGKSSMNADLGVLCDNNFKRDLVQINSIIKGLEVSPLMKHMNELADQQKKFQTLVEGSFASSSFAQISRSMAEFAKPLNDLTKMASLVHQSSFGHISSIVREHQAMFNSFETSVRPTLRAYQGMVDQIAEPMASLNAIVNSLKSTAFEEMVKRLTFHESPALFDALQRLAGEAEFADIQDIPFSNMSESEILDVEKEIEIAIDNPESIFTLSQRTKKILVFFFFVIFLPLMVNLSSNMIYDAWIAPRQNQEIDIKELARHLKACTSSEYFGHCA